MDPALRAFVQAAFAHRRKALARSLALAGRVRACRRTYATVPGPRCPSSAIPPTRARSASRRRTSGPCGRRSPRDRAPRTRAGEDQPLPARRSGARHDGRHELVSVMDTVSLADDLVLEPADGGADEVVCAGVEGPNLVAAAIEAFRARTGWDGAPVRITVTKRIPVAGGMAGGSADAAATLRLLAAHAGTGGDAARGDRHPAGRRRAQPDPRRSRAGDRSRGAAGARRTGRPLRRPRPAGRRRAVARPRSSRRPTGRAAHARRARGGAASGCAPTTSCRAAWRTTCSDRPASCARRSTARSPTPPRRAPTRSSCPARGRRCSGCSRGRAAPERARVAAAELAGRRPAAIAAEPVPAGWGTVDVTGVRHTEGDAR